MSTWSKGSTYIYSKQDVTLHKVQLCKTQKGIVLNENNVGDYVDSLIELKEHEANKEIISEKELDQVINDIYKRSDWRSYSQCVRDKKMIALDEFCFMQTLKYATYNVVFRDTEVPLDQNGRYCEPQEAVKQGFHTKIRDKANDADFMKLVHEFKFFQKNKNLNFSKKQKQKKKIENPPTPPHKQKIMQRQMGISWPSMFDVKDLAKNILYFIPECQLQGWISVANNDDQDRLVRCLPHVFLNDRILLYFGIANNVKALTFCLPKIQFYSFHNLLFLDMLEHSGFECFQVFWNHSLAKKYVKYSKMILFANKIVQCKPENFQLFCQHYPKNLPVLSLLKTCIAADKLTHVELISQTCAARLRTKTWPLNVARCSARMCDLLRTLPIKFAFRLPNNFHNLSLTSFRLWFDSNQDQRQCMFCRAIKAFNWEIAAFLYDPDDCLQDFLIRTEEVSNVNFRNLDSFCRVEESQPNAHDGSDDENEQTNYLQKLDLQKLDRCLGYCGFLLHHACLHPDTLFKQKIRDTVQTQLQSMQFNQLQSFFERSLVILKSTSLVKMIWNLANNEQRQILIDASFAFCQHSDCRELFEFVDQCAPLFFSTNKFGLIQNALSNSNVELWKFLFDKHLLTDNCLFACGLFLPLLSKSCKFLKIVWHPDGVWRDEFATSVHFALEVCNKNILKFLFANQLAPIDNALLCEYINVLVCANLGIAIRQITDISAIALIDFNIDQWALRLNSDTLIALDEIGLTKHHVFQKNMNAFALRFKLDVCQTLLLRNIFEPRLLWQELHTRIPHQTLMNLFGVIHFDF